MGADVAARTHFPPGGAEGEGINAATLEEGLVRRLVGPLDEEVG